MEGELAFLVVFMGRDGRRRSQVLGAGARIRAGELDVGACALAGEGAAVVRDTVLEAGWETVGVWCAWILALGFDACDRVR